MFKWIVDNKEWIFSGVGVALVAAIASWMTKKKGSGSRDGLRMSTSSQVIQIGGSVTAGGDVSITNVVTELKGSVSKKEFDRFQSEAKKDRGREKVQQWGGLHSSTGEWNWHLLGQAIEHYVDAIECDPTHQHPWTNLAYVFHLLGLKRNARDCLQESFRLASPGPNHPGNNFKQVARAVEADSYLSGSSVQRPPMPDWFREKYSRYLKATPKKCG